MQRELQACRTPEQRRCWEERWAEHLSGRMAQLQRAAASPGRPVIRRSYEELQRLHS